MPFIKQHFDETSITKNPGDDVLLAIALTTISLADGGLDKEEEELLEAYRFILPDWRLLEKSEAFRESIENHLSSLISAFQKRERCVEPDPFQLALFMVEDLAKIQSLQMRERCFLLSVDVAMAAGGITEDEDRVLEKMAKILKLDTATTTQIAKVMAMKFAS